MTRIPSFFARDMVYFRKGLFVFNDDYAYFFKVGPNGLFAGSKRRKVFAKKVGMLFKKWCVQLEQLMSAFDSSSGVAGSLIDSEKFDKVVKKLRDFFTKKGYVEAHTQNRLSILAACEDPTTITTYDYGGKKWPLPQTGQMWLEYELLSKPHLPGFFCVSTSYRNEPNPIPGRHDKIFPMFEFELKGGMDELEKMEKELLTHLGYTCDFGADDYMNVGEKYKVFDLEHEHEQKLYEEYGPVFFLKNFPSYTSPFWNMKRNETGVTANKVDVIMSGQETIGSAERETNKEMMLQQFNNIMDGAYKDKMFELFGEERTMAEMSDFLNFEFFPRSGGGIGVTRLIRSMKLEGLM